MSLSCFYSKSFMPSHLLNKSLMIRKVFWRSSKCAVNQSILIMISTRGMPVKTCRILWFVCSSADSYKYSSTTARASCPGSFYNWQQMTLSISLKTYSGFLSAYLGQRPETISNILFRYFYYFSSMLASSLSPTLLSMAAFSGLYNLWLL